MQLQTNEALSVASKPANLFGISLTAALAGFIFGFDTVVISGANLPIKELWNTSPLFHGFFIMSMALWGTVLGSIFGGVPTEKWGRKKVLIWIGILFSVSSIGSAVAMDPYSFSFFRFIGGVGIGVSSVAAPTYISEISTPATRGRLGAMYQFNIVFGILIAFLSNYFLKGFDGGNDWRWMLGVMLVPSLIYTLLVFRIPESPRWLIAVKKDELRAGEIMKQLGVINVQEMIASIRENLDSSVSKAKVGLFNRKYNTILWLAFMVAFFNQWSGINFVLYYAPEILERANIAAKDSLLSSVAIGLSNLIATFGGLYLIDRIGRKQLLLIGSFGYIISLSMVAYAFYAGAGPGLLLSSILLFVAAHALSQGAVIWVFISEIFPNNVRALGQSFGASTHWVFAAIITLITPVFLDKDHGLLKENPWPIFAFFCLMMVWQLIWVITKMPETKNVSLEELEKKLVKQS